MKKCVLVLGLLLLSSASFARMHETYVIHRGYDCYNNFIYTPHRIKGHTHYKVYYPMTGLSVNIRNGYNSLNMRNRSFYSLPRRSRNNISVNVSI